METEAASTFIKRQAEMHRRGIITSLELSNTVFDGFEVRYKEGDLPLLLRSLTTSGLVFIVAEFDLWFPRTTEGWAKFRMSRGIGGPQFESPADEERDLAEGQGRAYRFAKTLRSALRTSCKGLMSKSVEQKLILLLSQQLNEQRGFGAHEDLLLTYERVIDQRRRAYEKRWGKPVGKPRK